MGKVSRPASPGSSPEQQITHPGICGLEPRGTSARYHAIPRVTAHIRGATARFGGGFRAWGAPFRACGSLRSPRCAVAVTGPGARTPVVTLTLSPTPGANRLR